MKQFIIGENEAGQRFDKYLAKLLKEAPKSFFYKMMRKKNIVLNGKKATGNEKLKSGDEVRLYLSDETFENFAGDVSVSRAVCKLSVIYEDNDILLINKPAGMLSQPDKTGKPSLVEYVIGYLLEKGEITERDLSTFKPSVCNRLDRNTSGIVAAGKSLRGLQMLSALFHERTMSKYYLCVVEGVIAKENHIKGYLHKDEICNKVVVSKEKEKDSLPIETRYQPLGNNGTLTLLKVELLTGRSHQIRAHLASVGHAIIGDHKYGSRGKNQMYGEKYHLEHQLLHGYKLELPEMPEDFSKLSKRVFLAPVPELFLQVLKKEHLEEYYYEEME